MAVDTASKRASALGIGMATVALIIPSGVIGQAERQTIAHCYSGILADFPVIDTPDCITELQSPIDDSPTLLTGAIIDSVAYTGVIGPDSVSFTGLIVEDLNLTGVIGATEINLVGTICL